MMQRILSFSLTALALAVPRDVAAFTSKSSPSIVQISRAAYDVPRTKVSLQQSTENSTTQAEDTDDVTCFIVNDEEIITENEKPHVVCTSEPDDVSLLYVLQMHFMSLTCLQFSRNIVMLIPSCFYKYVVSIVVRLVQWSRSREYERG